VHNIVVFVCLHFLWHKYCNTMHTFLLCFIERSDFSQNHLSAHSINVLNFRCYLDMITVATHLVRNFHVDLLVMSLPFILGGGG
jgi:hypothetical protein